jgi:hypothetical protein
MIRKKNYIIIFVSFLFMLIFFSFMFNNSPSSMAEDVGIEIENGTIIKDFYRFGEVLDIPSSKLIYNGNEYNAVPILYLPNGQAVSKRKVDLLYPGLNTLKYAALLPNGREISKNFNFIVAGQLYSVGSDKSSLSFGNPEVYATDKRGILLSLANGDTFTFNKIIDLNGKGIDDNILRLFVIPNTIGVSDATSLVVTFTDIYDPTNYVNVTAKDGGTLGSWGIHGIYMVANSREQYPTGLEGQKVHINNDYGTGAKFSMSGQPDGNAKIGDRYFEISWNYEEKKVYGSKYRETEPNLLIADLDDTSYMTVPWKGFTTGEVIMSIHALGYQANTMGIVITNINGENLEENSFVDTEAPDIVIDTTPYGSSNNTFKAVTQKPFKIFEANAYDRYDKAVDVVSSVYFNYGSSEETTCNIADGYFTPSAQGLYTIVYTATDKFGNYSTEEIQINAINKTKKLSLFLDDEVKSSYSGQKVKIVSRLDILNNTGMVNLRITATLRSDSKIKYEINTLDYSFTPYYEGIYDIEYFYSDYIEEKKYNSILDIVPGDKPVFDLLPDLPRYLIKGNKLILPDAVAYDLSGGRPVPVEYSISVLEDDSVQPKAITEGYYLVEATKTAEIIYTASSGGNKQTYSKILPVIDTGYSNVLDMTKYFQDVSGSFQKTAYDDHILLSTTQDLSKLIFINPVQAFDFNLYFNPDGSKNNYNTLNIYLTDSINPNICLKMTYTKKSTEISGFRLNDENFVYEVKNNFFGQGDSFFSLRYNNEKLKLYPSIGFSVDVKNDLNGNRFTGFPSNKVYIEIELSGVSGLSALKVIKLNNQTLSNMADDIIGPELYVKASTGDRKVGEIITIKPAYAFDVLNCYVSMQLKVTAPDGSYVKNNNGLAMDGSVNPSASHSFTIDSMGQYLISYKAIDGNGNIEDYLYFINVIDTQPPVITLKDVNQTGKVNTTIKVASALVADNSDLDISIYIFVECPDGKIIYIDKGEFTPETKGIYKVNYITAVTHRLDGRTYYSQGDDYGNIGYQQYTINIS